MKGPSLLIKPSLPITTGPVANFGLEMAKSHFSLICIPLPCPKFVIPSSDPSITEKERPGREESDTRSY